jgi:hypothetical protein
MLRRTSLAVSLLVLCGALASCGGGTETVTVTVESGASESEPAEEQTPAPEGGVGDTLTLVDDYEQDGVDKDDELAVTLLGVTPDAPPDTDNPYELKEAIPKGYAPLRLQVEIEQMGDTESGGISYSNFSAIDSEGQRFEATSYEIFLPGLLTDGTLELPPGDSRLGYIAIPVPTDAEIVEVTMRDAGFVPPNTATWTVK